MEGSKSGSISGDQKMHQIQDSTIALRKYNIEITPDSTFQSKDII